MLVGLGCFAYVISSETLVYEILGHDRRPFSEGTGHAGKETVCYKKLSPLLEMADKLTGVSIILNKSTDELFSYFHEESVFINLHAQQVVSIMSL